MGQHPEQEHIYTLRRLRPDIYNHFVMTFLPYLVATLPDLISNAREKGKARQAIINPVLSPDTQPWPLLGATSEEPLTPADYALMIALELEISRLSMNDCSLHTCKQSPSLENRRSTVPQYVTTFAIAPRIDSYRQYAKSSYNLFK